VKKLPPAGEFSLLDVIIEEEPEQKIIVSFSDPLSPSQNLEGLIRLDNHTRLRFITEGNRVTAYPEERQQGEINLFIEPGIRNLRNESFASRHMNTLLFQSLKPAVRISGRGTIIPSSGGLVFPFEAVNLSSVRMRIIRIYEDNVTQFLQMNNLDGERDLKRAGRLVYERTIPLTGRALDPGSWNTWSVNLADHLEIEPGSIYRVELGFGREHSTYPAPGSLAGETAGSDGTPGNGTTWERLCAFRF
jgi:alpha-2-macroglobulin